MSPCGVFARVWASRKVSHLTIHHQFNAIPLTLFRRKHLPFYMLDQ
jgi:hypothetical protein